MDFSSAMLKRVVIITQGKSLEFTLNKIKHLIKIWGNAAMPTTEKLKAIDRKLDEISEKIQQLNNFIIHLITDVTESLRKFYRNRKVSGYS